MAKVSFKNPEKWLEEVVNKSNYEINNKNLIEGGRYRFYSTKDWSVKMDIYIDIPFNPKNRFLDRITYIEGAPLISYNKVQRDKMSVDEAVNSIVKKAVSAASRVKYTVPKLSSGDFKEAIHKIQDTGFKVKDELENIFMRDNYRSDVHGTDFGYTPWEDSYDDVDTSNYKPNPEEFNMEESCKKKIITEDNSNQSISQQVADIANEEIKDRIAYRKYYTEPDEYSDGLAIAIDGVQVFGDSNFKTSGISPDEAVEKLVYIYDGFKYLADMKFNGDVRRAIRYLKSLGPDEFLSCFDILYSNDGPDWRYGCLSVEDWINELISDMESIG